MHGFIFAFGDGFFFLSLPVYITQLNASATELGLLYAVFYLTWGISLLAGGFLADRFDPRKIIIVGTLLWLPLPLTLAVATNWNQLWLPMILYGTYFGSSSIYVYLLRSAAPGKTMQAFGLWSASWAFAYIFSPIIGGYISQVIGKQIMFVMSAIFIVASIGPLFLLTKSQKSEGEDTEMKPKFSFQDIISQKKLVFLCIFFAMIIFSIDLTEPFISKFLNSAYNQNIFNLGVFGTAISAGNLLFAVYLAKLGDLRSKFSSIIASTTLYSFSILIIVAFNNFPILCIASFLSGAAPCIWSFISGVIGSVAPKHYTGKWISFSQTTLYIASFVASIIGGMLYEISPYLVFFVTIIISSILTAIAFLKKL